MGCCSSKMQDPDGFTAYGKMGIPAQESIDFIIKQGQTPESYVKEIVTTPLLKGVNFATVDDDALDSDSDSVDNDIIENLLNEEDEEEQEKPKEAKTTKKQIDPNDDNVKFEDVNSNDEEINSSDEKQEI